MTAIEQVLQNAVSQVVADPRVQTSLYNLGYQEVRRAIPAVMRAIQPSTSSAATSSGWQAAALDPVLSPVLRGATDAAGEAFGRAIKVGAVVLVLTHVAAFLAGRVTAR